MRHWRTAVFAVIAAVPLVSVMAVGAPAQASTGVGASPARAQHQATAVKLSPGQCQTTNVAQGTDSGSVLIQQCESGVDVVPSSADASPNVAAAWGTVTFTVTACWGAGAYFGGKNGSFSCSEGFVQMTYELATNGSWLNLHWIDPKWGTSPSFSLTKTWQGVSGNNSNYLATGVNWNWSDLLGSGTVELRAFSKPCGGFVVCATTIAYWQGT